MTVIETAVGESMFFHLGMGNQPLNATPTEKMAHHFSKY